jgi:hypothetical protein
MALWAEAVMHGQARAADVATQRRRHVPLADEPGGALEQQLDRAGGGATCLPL